MRLAATVLTLAPVFHAFVLPGEWGSVGRWAAEAVGGVEEVLGGDETQKTIWQQIKDDDKYTKLVKILEFEGTIKKELDHKDSGYDITFFAVNNAGLTPPKHDDGDHDGDHDDVVPSLEFISQSLDEQPWLLEDNDNYFAGRGGKDKDGDKDKDKKRRKRIFKKIAHAVLKYHILPQAHDAQSLAQNSTMATALKPHDGSADGLARRIHIEKQVVPPALTINFYSRVKSSSAAGNGQLHELEHPLLPPGSIFDEMFVASKWLSTSTSAIQRAGGAQYLDWGYDREKSKPGKPKFSGVPLATFFAPSNDAWNALPPRLHFFLFSRFGRRALAKVLMYHAVPHTLVHAEVVHHAKHKDHKHKHVEAAGDDPSFRREFEVHSALHGAKLKVVAEKKRLLPIEGAVRTSMSVNEVEVKVLDVPASNGAWHVIDKVLCPPHEHKKGYNAYADPWADWEDWLPAWAETAQVQGW
jgi:uncharacterized surface protein with fasciclin (FAS1) repeats